MTLRYINPLLKLTYTYSLNGYVNIASMWLKFISCGVVNGQIVVCTGRRVKAMLENSGGKVAVGGKTDEENKYISPTLVVNVKLDDSIMQDEVY